MRFMQLAVRESRRRNLLAEDPLDQRAPAAKRRLNLCR